MPYIKNTWTDGVSPLSATRMNNLETQYEQVKAELGNNTGELWSVLKSADGDGSGLEADLWGGLKWLKPGADITLWQALDEEYTYNIKTLTKRFVAQRPGMYRFSGEAKMASSSESLTIYVAKDVAPGVIGVPALELTTKFVTSSTSYVSFSIDMTIPALTGDCFNFVFMKSKTDTYAYWKNLKITASEGVPEFATNGLHVVNLT